MFPPTFISSILKILVTNQEKISLEIIRDDNLITTACREQKLAEKCAKFWKYRTYFERET